MVNVVNDSRPTVCKLYADGMKLYAVIATIRILCSVAWLVCNNGLLHYNSIYVCVILHAGRDLLPANTGFNSLGSKLPVDSNV